MNSRFMRRFLGIALASMLVTEGVIPASAQSPVNESTGIETIMETMDADQTSFAETETSVSENMTLSVTEGFEIVTVGNRNGKLIYTLGWDTVKNAEGYEVRYRLASDLQGDYRVKKIENDTMALIESEDGQILVFQVRAYAKNGEDLVYGEYSTELVGNVSMSSLKITAPATELEVSKKLTLSVTKEPVYANETIVWSSSDPSIATVDEEGVVTAVDAPNGENQVTITGKGAVSGITVSIVLKVKRADQNHYAVDKVTIPVDEKYNKSNQEVDEQFTVAKAINLFLGDARYSSQKLKAKIEPENATDQTLTWKSSDDSIVSVNPSTGLITAKKLGNVVISATSSNGQVGKVSVYVLRATQDSGTFDLLEDTYRIYSNADRVLANDMIRNQTKILVNGNTENLSFVSSAPSIASVDEEGVVTASGSGIAVITVRNNTTGQEVSATVHVAKLFEEIRFPFGKQKIKVVVGSEVKGVPLQFLPEDGSKNLDNEKNIKITYVENNGIIAPIPNATTNVIPKNFGFKLDKGSTSNGSFQFLAKRVGTARLRIDVCDSYQKEGRDISIISATQFLEIEVVKADSYLTPTKLLITHLKTPEQEKEEAYQNTVLTNQDIKMDIRLFSGSTRLSLEDRALALTSSNEKVATVDSNGVLHTKGIGKTTITAKLLDGSNLYATKEVTVEEKPQSFTLEDSYRFIKETVTNTKADGTKETQVVNSIKITPKVVPASSAERYRQFNWKIEKVCDQNGNTLTNTNNCYFSLIQTISDNKVQPSESIEVKAGSSVAEGMYIVLVGENTKVVDAKNKPLQIRTKVYYQKSSITKLQFQKTTYDFVGLTPVSLGYTLQAPAGTKVSVSTAKPQVATAAMGKDEVILTPVGYGTTAVTLRAGDKTSTCIVTILPVVRGKVIAKKAEYVLQTAQNKPNDSVKLEFTDSEGNTIDPSLLSIDVGGSKFVYVEQNTGIAHVYQSVSVGGEVTVTASVKNDPLKREASTKIIVSTNRQVERLDLKYFSAPNLETTDSEEGYMVGADGLTAVFKETGGKTKKVAFRVSGFGYNQYGRLAQMKLDKEKFAVASTDKNIAEIKQVEYSILDPDSLKVFVELKAEGSCMLSFAVSGDKYYLKSIPLTVCSGRPILDSLSIGQFEIQSNYESEFVTSETEFVLHPTGGSKIAVENMYVTKVKVENQTIAESNFRIISLGNDRYKLQIKKEILQKMKGEYEATLFVERSGMIGPDGTKIEVDDPTNRTKETILTKFYVKQTVPNREKLKDITVSLNSFIKGKRVELPISTEHRIKSVRVTNGTYDADYFEVIYVNGRWYIKIKDEKFTDFKRNNSPSKVKENHLDLTVTSLDTENVFNIKCNVKTSDQKPALKQTFVPKIRLDLEEYVDLPIVYASGVALKNYQVEFVKADGKRSCAIDIVDGKLRITPNKDLKVGTYEEKLRLSSSDWNGKVILTITYKVQGIKKKPGISFEKKTVTINRYIGEKSVKVKVNVDLANTELKSGEWKICKTGFFSKTPKYNANSELFDAVYEDGYLTISLKEGVKPSAGNYPLCFTEIWESDETHVTNSINVKIITTTKPTANLKFTGSMNIVRRSRSTLTGTISSLEKTNARVTDVTFTGGYQQLFYCKYDGKKNFTIYAYDDVALKTQKYRPTLQFTLDNGCTFKQDIAFGLKQKLPSIQKPEAQSIYKVANKRTVRYDLSKGLSQGFEIENVELAQKNSNFRTQYANGNFYVTLVNDKVPTGTYKLKINVYMKGAQLVEGTKKSKPIVKEIKVYICNR